MDGIKFSLNNDIKVSNINDLIPEKVIKIYPYELPNANKSEEFIGEQTTSIASITQKTITDEFILTDENGKKYFEMFSAITSQGVLDYSSSTSTIGQEFKEEDSFTSLSNWYYEGELEKIKIGNLRFLPAIFCIGEPFDIHRYTAGDQTVFMSPKMIEAKEGRAQYKMDELDTDGLYEFELINITSIESSFINSKITFTDDSKLIDQRFSVKNPPVKVELENHTLLGGIKGKGSVKSVNSSKELTEYSNIDFFSDKALTPIKMTPTSVDDKLTMYVDWFDYNTVLPWVYVKDFTSDNNSSDKSLKTLVKNSDDYLVIEKMIVISTGFADSWTKAPRYTDDEAKAAAGITAGQIKASFSVLGIAITAIAGKQPLEVINGIYESHLANDPTYLESTERQRILKGAISALSRYIYSSYSIGKGRNSFNALYLPWYLILGSTIDYANWNSNSIINVATRTNYFKQNFTSLDDFTQSGTIELPNKINLSNQIMLSSDRPTSLPTIPQTLTSINKLPLAGDIDTSTSESLSYLWFIPVDNIDKMRKLYIDSENLITSKEKGQDVTTKAIEVSGNLNQLEANEYVINQYPGSAIKVPPTVTFDNEIQKHTETATAAKQPDAGGTTLGYKWVYTWPDGTSAGEDNIVAPMPPTREVSVTIEKTVIGEATLTLTKDMVVKNYSIGKRQLEFDKDAWETFLYHFDIVPGQTTEYPLELDSAVSISKIDEIILTTAWGNYAVITIGNADPIVINLFNSINETITTQRIIFT